MKLVFKEKIAKEGDVVQFVFTPVEPATWQAGQYAHYVLPHDSADDRGDERWFTISSAPFEQDIWISTRINSERSSTFKQKLASLNPGEVIETDEPEGDFTVNDLTKDYIFIVGGIGITPVGSILNQLHHEGQNIRAELLWANRDEATIPYKDKLEAIVRDSNGKLNISYFIGDNYIDEAALKAASEKLDNPIYYISGPEPMAKALKETLKNIGIDDERIKLDDFPGYETI